LKKEIDMKKYYWYLKSGCGETGTVSAESAQDAADEIADLLSGKETGDTVIVRPDDENDPEWDTADAKIE
jgi:hypothetical protein